MEVSEPERQQQDTIENTAIPVETQKKPGQNDLGEHARVVAEKLRMWNRRTYRGDIRTEINKASGFKRFKECPSIQETTTEQRRCLSMKMELDAWIVQQESCRGGALEGPPRKLGYLMQT